MKEENEGGGVCLCEVVTGLADVHQTISPGTGIPLKFSRWNVGRKNSFLVNAMLTKSSSGGSGGSG